MFTLNRQIGWATESTGTLQALHSGLRSLDPCYGDVGRKPLSWTCRSGEVVGVGDAVALCYGSSSDLVVRIASGTTSELQCEVVRGAGMAAGERVTVVPEQLLVKLSARAQGGR
jgi:hypothetical protein